MKYKDEIVPRTHELSMRMLELYVELIKSGEFELSQRILKHGTSIREHLDEAIAVDNTNDFLYKISLAYNDAVQTRFWIKQVQMKHFVHTCCDDCVSRINELISILAYMGQSVNGFKINFQYQLN